MHDILGNDGRKSISARSHAYYALTRHSVGNIHNTREFLAKHSVKDWEMIFPDELQRFSKTLKSLSRYFLFPWYGIQVPDRHQFHAHNFLQRLLINEIRQLKAKDPIQLELFPLPLYLGTVIATDIASMNSRPFQTQPKRAQTESIGEDTPAKRRKYEQSQADDGDIYPNIRFSFCHY